MKPKSRTASTDTSRQRLFVIDDSPIFTAGLQAIVGTEPDFIICGSAPTIPAAWSALAAMRPRVVILELELMQGDTLGFIRDAQKRLPHSPVLAVTTALENTYAFRALQAGARGYLSKRAMPTELLEALRTVAAGDVYAGHTLSQKILKHTLAHPATDTGLDWQRTLSNREMQVFRGIALGRTVKEIAATLGTSAKTVECHRQRLRQKLQCASSAELLQFATRWDLETKAAETLDRQHGTGQRAARP